GNPMRSFSAVTVASMVLGFLQPLAARAQQSRPPAMPGESSAPQEGLERVASEAGAAFRKLQRPRRKANAENKVLVIPLKKLKAKEVAKALKKIYRRSPGFAVAALPEVNCVIIRADDK